MAQTTLITDLVSLVTPNNNDVFVVVDNTSDPSLSVTKKISYADLKESLQDMIDTMVTEGTGINASYSDVANTLTLSVVADTTLQKGIISSGGTEIGQRQEINFIPGASVTLSGADNANDNRVDLTINTTAVSTSVNATVSGTSYNVLSSINTLGDGTKELEFRPIKAASAKAVVNYGDSDNSITVDVNPGAIPITDLDTSAPLPVNLGGTGGNTAALARGGIGAAKAGANSDITSLSALTTPLSIAQGGTGGNTTQDALENLQGLKFVESVGIAGESIVATNSKVVGGEYRAEIKGLQVGSNKLQLTSTNNDITLDIDADNVLGAASQNVDLNGYRLTNIGAPIGTSDAATKDYVDSRSQGFAVKASAVAATTASLSGTYNGGPDFTFTLAPTGTPTIDTVNITATGTRVLFKDQANGYENGIYELTTSGDFGVNAVFTRTEDYDSDAEILAGTIVFIESGSTNIGKQFIQITSEPTIDADPLEFAVLSDTIIPQGSVTNVKLDNMDALRVKGTLTAGVPQDLTPDNVIEIVNSGTTEIDEPRLPKATTSATGLTRLYDDVDSVSSSRAATANAVKTAYDAAISASGDAATAQSAANAAQATADAALPVSGGTMTGLINFAVGQDFPGEVEASGSTLTDGTYVNPTLTGITSAPTQSVGTSDNQIATTAFVNAEIANDAPSKTGSGASGTWGINVTGNAGTATKLATPRTINLGGDLSGSAAFDGSGNITLSAAVVNNSVALGANTTGSYVANATTTGNGISGSVNTEGGTFTVTSNATSASTANTIVFRNSSGNFSANLITASLNGNASTATKLATARTIALTGDISGSASFDGSSNISISTAIGNNALALGTNTTGNYVAVGATSGNGISGSSSSEGGTFTVTSNATSANTAGTIVYRDGNGNFNAGTITASLNGNASSASELATARTISLTGGVTGSVSFDGSANVGISTSMTTPINIPPSGTNNSDIFFRGSSNRPAARINCFYNSSVDAGSLSFYALKPGETEPTRRYRLTYIGTHEFHTDQVNAIVAMTAQGASNSEYVFSGASNAASITSTRVTRSAIASNGSFFSATGVYTTGFSDIAAKENVEDANSQWNDVKNLRVVNFNFKEDWMPGITERQIGFIAQEVETVCPNLVVDTKFNGNEGKTIKTSIIHIKAFKALQEAMERIETLEATNEALTANLQALEARLEALEAR